MFERLKCCLLVWGVVAATVPAMTQNQQPVATYAGLNACAKCHDHKNDALAAKPAKLPCLQSETDAELAALYAGPAGQSLPRRIVISQQLTRCAALVMNSAVLNGMHQNITTRGDAGE